MTEPEPPVFGVFLREETFKVELGPDRTQYSVHPSLLAYYSKYFRRALNGPWKEAEDHVIKLHDVDCKTFEIFAEWLYTGNYPEDSQFCSCSSHGFCCCRQLARVKACEFGHRFQANDFMLESEDALVDSIIANTPWYETIIYAFDHLRPTSPVLQAIIDKHCHTWDEKIDEIGNELDLRSKLPYDFWMGVSLRYMQIRGGREEALDRCDYHRHESDKERGRNCEVPRIDNFSDDDDDANTTV